MLLFVHMIIYSIYWGMSKVLCLERQTFYQLSFSVITLVRAGSCNELFTRLSWATMMTEMMTSKNHELILPMWTSDQAASWFGYCQAPRKVVMFSAIQMKNPINRNDRIIGIVKIFPSMRNDTTVRKKISTSSTFSPQRISYVK